MEGWRVANVCVFLEEETLWRVFGELTNETGSSQEEVQVMVTFFAADDSSLAGDSGYVPVNVIPVGATVPFDIVVESPTVPAEYGFDSSSTPSVATLRDNLQVSNAQLTVAGDEALITGQVYNPGPDLVDYVELIATLYDEQGAVVAMGYELLSPEELGTSESATFEILADGLCPLVTDYVVIAVGF